MKTAKDDEEQKTVPLGATCTHPRMEECHPGCGHFSCPDCGLSWDDEGEG